MKKVVKAVGSPWGQRVTLLVIICIVMIILEPRFFRVENAKGILLAIAVNGIMACGMLFTVLVGGMDLSVGSMAGISASIAFVISKDHDFSGGWFIAGCAVALALCLATGIVNGFFVTRFGLPAFVVTLAMKYILYGSIYMVTRSFFVIPPVSSMASRFGNGSILGVPMPIVVFVIIVAVSAFVLGITTYGRKLYAIGGNKNVANLAGIKSNLNIMIAYMLSSVLAGLGGVLLASMNGQAGQTTAINYEGNVLMAMVVGGINLAGGEGGVPGAIFGALLVGVINNAMLMLSISSDIQKFVQGVIILAAMTLNMYAKRGSSGALRVKTARS